MTNDLITKLTARRDAAQKDLNKLEAQKAGFEIAINKAQSALSMANDMLDIAKEQTQTQPASKTIGNPGDAL